MKDSEVLRAAQQRIKDGNNDFICFAIQDSNIGTREQKEKLISWICSMIKPKVSFETWLSVELGASYYSLSLDKCRQHRIAWLDQLIAICKSEGD